MDLEAIKAGCAELRALAAALSADHGNAAVRVNLCGKIARLAADLESTFLNDAPVAPPAEFDPAHDCDYAAAE